MKTNELPIELQELIVACEYAFFKTDMTATDEDFDEQVEYLLNSDLDELRDIFKFYTEMIEEI